MQKQTHTHKKNSDVCTPAACSTFLHDFWGCISKHNFNVFTAWRSQVTTHSQLGRYAIKYVDTLFVIRIPFFGVESDPYFLGLTQLVTVILIFSGLILSFSNSRVNDPYLIFLLFLSFQTYRKNPSANWLFSRSSVNLAYYDGLMDYTLQKTRDLCKNCKY